MQNDNLSANDELRQMRSDYERLKTDMDKQTVISGQLMETVFRNKTGVLDSGRRSALTGAGAAILVTLALSYIKGLDGYLVGMTVAFYVLMMIGYVLVYRKLGKIEYGADSVLSTVTRLKSFKRNYLAVNILSWLLVAVLMGFLFPEIRKVFHTPEQGVAAMVFLGAALLAGAVAQYAMDRKVLRTCDDIIDRLQERS